MFEEKLPFIYLVSIYNIKVQYYIIKKKSGTSKTVFLKINLHPILKMWNLKTTKKRGMMFFKVPPVDFL